MPKVLLLISSLVFSINSFSQTQNFLEKSYLETSATYTTEVTPDNLYLTILVTESDTKGKVSVEALESQMINKLNGLGIDTGKQLKLLDLTSDFKKSLLRKTDVLKNKEYSLLLHSASIASKVIQALEQVNISNIRLTKTEYSKLEELKIELKGKAVQKAKRQATAMLKPLDQAVGKAIFISDTPTNTLQFRGSNTALNTLNLANYADFGNDKIEINKKKGSGGSHCVFRNSVNNHYYIDL